MDSRKTSRGFAKTSINILKYVVMTIIIIICASAAFSFGTKIFSNEGVDEAPGTDMTFTVEEGTSIKELGETLEEFRIIGDATVFRVQAWVYSVSEVEPGTYTFNTSQSGEEIFEIISNGPEDDSQDDETVEE